MQFTFEAYKNLLEDIIGNGYQFSNYYDWQKVEYPCIIRHDVDMDMEKAVCFSDFEARYSKDKDQLREMGGVKATYFVLLNTDFYNLHTKTNRKRMDRIMANGHEIGLHFDEMQYDLKGNTSAIIEKIQEEAEMLSKLVCKKITTVSMHRPSSHILDANLSIPGLVNSYSTTYFQFFKYLSDSRMHWREDVETIVASRKYSQLHILVHPFWYSDDEKSMKEILGTFVCSSKEARYQAINENFRDLKSILKYEDC